tara:strand:- start:1085 stop:2230 length:1146 start_codon:yes stop_codon:yes gene_type:complete
MKCQKICIIGDGLAGLVTSVTLKNLNIQVDLIYKKTKKEKTLDYRTTAISENNYKFLKSKMNFKIKNLFWASRNIDLFYERNDKFFNFLKYQNKKKNSMYIFENEKFKKHIYKILKNSKNVNLISKPLKDLNFKECFIKINNKKFYYDLIILCLGKNSSFYEKINKNRSIVKNYKEISITGAVKHASKIYSSSQFFLKEGPLAILPFKKNFFSFVWSISKDFYLSNIEQLKPLIKKKLINILGEQSKFKILKIQSYPLRLNLETKYFNKNVLMLGQGIHSIHPIAGQGFNLILRDIKKLSELIHNKIRLGIAIKNSYLLKEFYDLRNPENTIIGLGNDLTNSFFKRNKILDPLKYLLLKNIKDNQNLKKVSRIIADKGLLI